MEYKNISVKIVADSISPQGIRLTTYELQYPRYIHAEIMTHRVFSRNAQSSRAVPVKKALEMECVTPIVWGKNVAGMSSVEELEDVQLESAKALWDEAVNVTKIFSSRLAEQGLHKQWVNRMTEWFSPIKVVVTATEWDNFFWLRIDPEAAQPEIVELARKMRGEMYNSTPQLLQPGEWHLPYITTWREGETVVYNVEVPDSPASRWAHVPKEVDLETAKKVSAGCCAAVSYRNNPSIEKCLEIWDKLFSGPKPHLSPVEHQATPMIQAEHNVYEGKTPLEEGITSYSSDLYCYSGNLRGWVQLRQVI